MTHIGEYRLLPGVVRYTFIIFGLFTTPNLCPPDTKSWRRHCVTKFCDIGTGDFRFRFSADKGISFSSAFSFTAENEKKNIFGQLLHQTVSDYTIRQ